MINFFRKKRKTLADENQPNGRAGRILKYARYAFGEIVNCSVRKNILVAYLNKTTNRAFRCQKHDIKSV